jgi:hypothetical protein
MEQKTENRQCQNCKQDFNIEPEDFEFYKKIDVPAPTHCPQCRLQRRLVWFKGLRLYKRVCDLCQKEAISMYRPDAPYVVYCPKCWYSDKWDPLDYGQEYDSERPFFEQLNELFHKVPLLGVMINDESLPTSPFNNHISFAKNAYLTFYSGDTEDCINGFYISKGKRLLDTSIYWESEECYDGMNGYRNHRVHGSRSNVHESMDCYFLKDCKNAQYCFGSSNLRNKKYVFFNEQLTKEEYEKRMAEIDLGSYKTYQEMKTKAREAWKATVPHPAYDFMYNENVTGSYVFHSKNCIECYSSGYCEDCKYVMLIKKPTVKDCYDYVDWGDGAERIYECVTVGGGAMDVKFSRDVGLGVHDIEYTHLAWGINEYLFGCSSMRRSSYCILNKQYPKEEYFALRERIVSDMKERGEHGEFFPMTLSPHDYNDTFAQMFFPLSKEESLGKGLTWAEDLPSAYETTKSYEELPDHISDADESIFNEVVKCADCSRGYKVIPAELSFLRQYNFPLPRRCPFCRIEARVKQWAKEMTLIDRVCDSCSKDFRLPYTKEQAPTVYCKDCYFEKVV